MSQQKVLRRIRLGSLVLMIGVGLELLRYLYRSFDRALTFAFFDPEQWNAHWRVDAGTVIETAPRLGYFAIWTTIILLSAAAFVAGLVLLNHVRQGRLFDTRSAAAIRRLGFILAVAMVADLIFHAIDPWLITRFNAEPEAIRFGYDPSDLKTLTLALLLFLFGWVMQESVEVDRENRSFV